MEHELDKKNLFRILINEDTSNKLIEYFLTYGNYIGRYCNFDGEVEISRNWTTWYSNRPDPYLY